MEFSEKLVVLLRLIVTFMFAVINGIDLSFNVYAVTLKETFNFTQTQVEIVASMGSLGSGLGFVEPLLIGRFGHVSTSVITWVFFPLSCGLFSLAAVYPTFIQHRPVIVYFIQLILSASSNIAYVLVTRATLEIVPQRLTGTFIGAFGTAVCFGKIFLAGLSDLFFYEDLIVFFGCLCVIVSVTLGMWFAMFSPVITRLNQDGENTDVADKCPDGINIPAILRSPSFHMTFWSSTLFSAASFVILNNITSVTASIGMRDSFQTVTTMSVCIMASRLLYGFVFDKFSSVICGFILMCIGYVSLGVGLYLGMYHMDTETIHILTVLCGVGIGAALYLPLSVLLVQFGRTSYDFLSTSLLSSIAAGEIVLQVLIGLLYDSKLSQLGYSGGFCYPDNCFFSSFVLLFSIVVFVCFLQGINCAMTYYKQSH